MADKSEPPVFKAQYGAVQTVVFLNKSEFGGIYSISQNRSYKDKAGQWQHTQSFRQNDIQKLILGLNEAFKWIMEHPIKDGKGEE